MKVVWCFLPPDREGDRRKEGEREGMRVRTRRVDMRFVKE